MVPRAAVARGKEELHQDSADPIRNFEHLPPEQLADDILEKELRIAEIMQGIKELPRGICKDVTGLGRWGNGDVEVGLSSIDDLPYIIGRVRQAYEKQIGSGAE